MRIPISRRSLKAVAIATARSPTVRALWFPPRTSANADPDLAKIPEGGRYRDRTFADSPSAVVPAEDVRECGSRSREDP